MPYARNADLPSAVRNVLPPQAQNIYRAVANAQLRGGKSEEIAARTAWAAVGRGWKKGPKGIWVHKRSETLYTRRNVENAADIIKWAKGEGFETTLPASDMHATIAYSKNVVEWPEPDDDAIIVRSPTGRALDLFGPDKDTAVLKFQNKTLARRWDELCKMHGASWDHESYIPHVTISKNFGDLDIAKVKPYTGEIILGPEVFEPVKESWSEGIIEKIDALDPKAMYTGEAIQALISAINAAGQENDPYRIIKADTKLGLIFGWAIVSKQGGEEYYDTQGDHIPEDAMLEAAADFMEKKRVLKFMHRGQKKGEVVFAWPLTSEIAKAMGLRTNTTGLMIAVKPASKSIFKDIEDGKITGFSIGGSRIEDEDKSEGNG